MSNVGPILVAVLSAVAGLVGATFSVGLMVFGMANAPASHYRLLRIGSIVVAALTLACVIATVVLLARGKPWAAVATGGAPAVIGLATILILTLLGV